MCCVVAAVLALLLSASGQSTGGRIIGRVSDSTGAVVSGVQVTLTNEATGGSRDTKTNDTGDYTFVEVTPGNYHVEYALQGFKKDVRSDVVLEVNQVLTLNATLQPGATQETVEVSSEAPLIDTTSTQLGAVVDDRSLSQLPLNARDTYQFLQLQPGVMSSVGSSNSIVYGSDSPGAVSVNGGRGRSNNFSVNGGDANDLFANLPTVQPTPDSIQEFKVLTNTFDAEYGRNSGSVVNVVTKSGTNALHGDVYEFFRNAVLNADQYCLTATEGVPCEKAKFNQNQFGGTLGGPIKKDRTFFFVSYEGRRIRQGILSPAATVPAAAERPSATQPYADYSEGLPVGSVPFTGTLTNSYPLTLNPRCATDIATQTQGQATLQDGAPYGATYDSSGNRLTAGIFTDVVNNRDNIIPLSCMDPTAVDLLQFVPTPSQGNLITTTPVRSIRGDQFTFRVDHRINDKQNLSIYYYFDDDHTLQPFSNFQLAGADVPGFGSIFKDRYQQWNITHAWTLSNNVVNEFRFTYNREGQGTFNHPQTTSLIQNSCPPAPSWLTSIDGAPPCFYGDVASNSGPNATGIHPLLGANREGLPFIQISGGFSLGNNSEGELPQVGNSFQWSDGLTKVSGKHTLKFGVDARRQRFDQFLYYNVNGTFYYYGGGPNDVGAGNLYPNYLLGLPDEFGQGSAQIENVRNTGFYAFAQDSWKIRSNVTLNYGLRWELDTPLADIGHHVQTFRPGQVSTVYSCGGPNTDCTSQSAIGMVFPGDAGIPNGLTQTYYKAFAPRIGIAWSPGNSGKTSIRAGWGLFYNPVEQLVLEQFSAEPPFGGSTFVYNTQFNNPFLDQSGSFSYLNAFNGVLNAPRHTAQDWAKFEPILLFGDFQPHMRTQYSAQYNLTIQRELTKDMKLEVAYVGTQGHRLLATHDVNYANPQTCLDIVALANHNPTNVTSYGSNASCGQFLEDNQYTVTLDPSVASDPTEPITQFHMPNGSVLPLNNQVLNLVGLRPYSSPQCDPLTGNGCPASQVPVFSSIFAQDTIANSGYNSLQASLDKKFTNGLQFTAAYTFSKSIDEASSFEGILNPLPNAHNRALSLFDARHRFVLSYYWELPMKNHSGFSGKLLDGWALSGITTYQTGFPIRITSQSDNELMSSFDFELPGEPDQVAPFRWQRPQSNGNYYFNSPSSQDSIFTESTVFGRVGTAPRTICCGPGISDTDFAILKNIAVSERSRFEFRAEFFNLFNHTQFYNPDGYSSDGSQFGQVTQVKDPRLVQFALKLYF